MTTSGEAYVRAARNGVLALLFLSVGSVIYGAVHAIQLVQSSKHLLSLGAVVFGVSLIVGAALCALVVLKRIPKTETPTKSPSTATQAVAVAAVALAYPLIRLSGRVHWSTGLRFIGDCCWIALGVWLTTVLIVGYFKLKRRVTEAEQQSH